MRTGQRSLSGYEASRFIIHATCNEESARSTSARFQLLEQADVGLWGREIHFEHTMAPLLRIDVIAGNVYSVAGCNRPALFWFTDASLSIERRIGASLWQRSSIRLLDLHLGRSATQEIDLRYYSPAVFGKLGACQALTCHGFDWTSRNAEAELDDVYYLEERVLPVPDSQPFRRYRLGITPQITYAAKPQCMMDSMPSRDMLFIAFTGSMASA